MCGRYTQTADARTLAGRFRLAKLGVEVSARYNISPGRPIACSASWRTIQS